ncbi:MAG: hypothetical protein FWF75_06670, partial [Propionibacteriaceae bacterium]|nr:hypothetical protein [Propionibacteriaceae bacterium]
MSSPQSADSSPQPAASGPIAAVPGRTGWRAAVNAVLGQDLKRYTMMVALVVLLVFFQFATAKHSSGSIGWGNGQMFTSSNFQNLVIGNAYVLILALGMLMVIVIGQIDLSVGSVAGFIGMSVARCATDLHLSPALAVLLGIVFGVVIGAWQGFWLAKVGIPGFITTLAGMMLFRGATIWLSQSVSIPVPTSFSTFSSGYLPEWGPDTGMNNSTVLLGLVVIVLVIVVQVRSRARQLRVTGSADPVWALVVRLVIVCGIIAYVARIFATGRYGTSFPIVGLIVGALIFIYAMVTERTPYGRHIYAVGGNRAAAALSGVNVSRTYFITMVNMSFLAALAGILFTGRASAAGPDLGTGWELDAIAAVFIGGAAVTGGIGTVVGTVVGALVMAVLNNGLMALGV